MISTDGASLLAGVFPVGLLVLVIELRQSVHQLASDLRFTMLRVLLAIVLIAAVVGAIASVAVCAFNVSADTPIKGAPAVFVMTSGLVLAVVVAGPIATSTGQLVFALITGKEEGSGPGGSIQQRALEDAIAQESAAGWTVTSLTTGQAILQRNKRLGWFWNLIFTVLSAGLWLIVVFLKVIDRETETIVITADSAGNITRR